VTEPRGTAVDVVPPPARLGEARRSRPSPTNGPGVEELVAALRTLPFGGIDDHARHLAFTPQVRAAVAPVVIALRWSAVMYGMIFGAGKVFREGSYSVVLTLTVCLFLTTWRTSIPVRLGSTVVRDRVLALTDTALLALAVGWSGATESPYRFTVHAAVVVAAFGWGYGWMVAALAVAAAGLALGGIFSPDLAAWSPGASIGAFALPLVAVGLLAAFARARLLESERRRLGLTGRLETLAEANDLLTMLNSVARTLPTSLNQREALDAARSQLVTTFRANVICLLELDEAHDEWVPKLAEGCVLRPTTTTSDLPLHLRRALDHPGPLLVGNLAESGSAVSAGSGSGIYVRLEARGRLVGVLGLEHPVVEHFRDRDRRLVAGVSDVLALTLDNARWFGRLRSLGAEEERSRIARDLHDRLGQWLTYISFELESIIAGDAGRHPELGQLYTDVQRALEELRDTLRQLRSGVSEDQPLEQVAREVVERFAERTDLDVRFEVGRPGARLSPPIENEVLRILQEALTNIDRHAKADHVRIRWDVADGSGTLTVTDDGRGFDAAQGVRDNAYGLVGMRERADVAGGRLTIHSTPGAGTTITVVVGASGTKEE